MEGIPSANRKTANTWLVAITRPAADALADPRTDPVVVFFEQFPIAGVVQHYAWGMPASESVIAKLVGGKYGAAQTIPRTVHCVQCSPLWGHTQPRACSHAPCRAQCTLMLNYPAM